MWCKCVVECVCAMDLVCCLVDGFVRVNSVTSSNRAYPNTPSYPNWLNGLKDQRLRPNTATHPYITIIGSCFGSSCCWCCCCWCLAFACCFCVRLHAGGCVSHHTTKSAFVSRVQRFIFIIPCFYIFIYRDIFFGCPAGRWYRCEQGLQLVMVD